MRILHLPTSVGGHSWGLAQGEKRLGLDSTVLVKGHNFLEYRADRVVHIPERGFFRKPIGLMNSIRAFFDIRRKYDVFHFNFGSSLIDYPKFGLSLCDLPYYPPDSKLFVTYNGCDARQKYPTMQRTAFSACHNPECYGGVCNSGKQDAIRRRKIEKFSLFARHIFAVNPDLLWFLPKEKSSFLPYTVANWYEDSVRIPFVLGRKIRIVHAPTNRVCKGSEIILQSLERVQKRFPGEVEIVLVENMSHSMALSVYREADLVVDQILVGWYGGLAVEVMRMGKPVAVFIREEDLQFIPGEMRKDIDDAFIRISPETIDEVLCRCIADRELLREKGENGFQYVHKWHDPVKIARLVKEYYDA